MTRPLALSGLGRRIFSLWFSLALLTLALCAFSFLLETKGWRSVLVVSDPPHMRRLSWVWNKVFDGTEMSFYLIPAPMPLWNATHWWQQRSSATYVLRELIKLGYYHAVY